MHKPNITNPPPHTHTYTYISHNFLHPGRIACCSAPNSRPPTTKALHTICGSNTSTVSSSWWWTYKCPKHVERIISAITHSAASSWFSSLRLYIFYSLLISLVPSITQAVMQLLCRTFVFGGTVFRIWGASLAIRNEITCVFFSELY